MRRELTGAAPLAPVFAGPGLPLAVSRCATLNRKRQTKTPRTGLPRPHPRGSQQRLLDGQVVLHAVVRPFAARDTGGKFAEVGDLQRPCVQVESLPISLA